MIEGEDEWESFRERTRKVALSKADSCKKLRRELGPRSVSASLRTGLVRAL
jgi:hypothetical protein